MRVLLAIILIGLTAEVNGQILPGMKRQDIPGHVASDYKGYVLREPPNREELEFMTFEHVTGDKTLLVFFGSDDTCTFTRLMVDIDYLDEVRELYDVQYEPVGENTWHARVRGGLFGMTLEEGEWMFTVTVRKIDDE